MLDLMFEIAKLHSLATKAIYVLHQSLQSTAFGCPLDETDRLSLELNIRKAYCLAIYITSYSTRGYCCLVHT